MNRDLFLAILALDSYNKGYGKRLAFVGSQTGRDASEVGRQMGTATIVTQDISDLAVDADFYAIAYNWNGETIISYRGTDNLVQDAISGYGVGAGIAGVPQGNLAIEFYSAVTGRAAFDLGARDVRGARSCRASRHRQSAPLVADPDQSAPNPAAR